MTTRLDSSALRQLFTEARTFSKWQDTPVAPELLRELYDLVKYGPTSANGSPARFVFVTSPDAKARLRPALAEGNVDKTMQAPVTVIIGADHDFFDQLPTLFPQADARSWFADNPELAQTTALRNSSLQGAYLILAARALGLDAGPMSGFDAAAVDAAFFRGTSVHANFLVNLGYGERAALHPRNPRLDFEQAAQIV